MDRLILLRVGSYTSSYGLSPRHSTEQVLLSSFFSGGFITAIVVNSPEGKLAKRTSVQWGGIEIWKPELLQIPN